MEKSNTFPKAVIFDWDNTLVSTWNTIHRVYNDLLKEYGFKKRTLAETKIECRQSLKQNSKTLFNTDYSTLKSKFINYYQQADHDLVLLDDVEELLNTLEKLSIPKAIISNKIAISLHNDIEKLNYKERFFNIIGSGDLQEDKPSSVPVDYVLQKFPNIDREDVWFVGDSIADIECAVNSGCQPVLYGDDEKVGEMQKIAPHLIHVNNHKKFIELLV